MTFTEVLAGLLILSLFVFGFSQAVYPAYRSWQSASEKYTLARELDFIAESFRKECKMTDRSIERWEYAVSSVNSLESTEVSELRKDGALCAMKARCVVNGEIVEIIAECNP